MNLFAVCHPAHLANLSGAGMWLREAQIVGNRSVEKEILLEHDAEVGPEIARFDRTQVTSVYCHPRLPAAD